MGTLPTAPKIVPRIARNLAAESGSCGLEKCGLFHSLALSPTDSPYRRRAECKAARSLSLASFPRTWSRSCWRSWSALAGVHHCLDVSSHSKLLPLNIMRSCKKLIVCIRRKASINKPPVGNSIMIFLGFLETTCELRAR